MSDQDERRSRGRDAGERGDDVPRAPDTGLDVGTQAQELASGDDAEADEEPQAFLSVRDLVQELERPTRSNAEFIVALCRSNAAHDRGVAALALCERLVAGAVTEQDVALLGLALRDELCAALEEGGGVNTPNLTAGASRRFKVPHPNGERLWVEVEARVDDDTGSGERDGAGGGGKEREASVTFLWCGLIGAPVPQRPFFALTTQGLVVFEPYTTHRARIPALLGGMLRELYT